MAERDTSGKFFHKDVKSGEVIRSGEWNTGMNEIVRLEDDKVNRRGTDTLVGPIVIQEALGLGRVSLTTVAAGGSRLKVANSDTDLLDVRFAAAGGGSLEVTSWVNGWTLNTKTTGKHLYLNRDVANTSDVYIGRSGNELFVRGNDGSVGIGTTSILNTQNWKKVVDIVGAGNARLNVRSANTVTTGIFSHDDWSGARGLLGTESNHPLTFITNYTNQMTIDTAGKVGIGTTSPDSRLTVNNNIAHDNNFSYSDAAVTIFDPTSNGGSSPAAARDILHLVREGVSNQAFGNKASFALSRYENNGFNSRTQLDLKLTDGNFNTHTPVMSLRSNGNVGIGTTTPNDRLDINGNLKATSATISTSLSAESINVSKRLSVTESLTVGNPGASVGNASLNVAGVVQAEQLEGQIYRCEVPVLQFDGTDDYVDLGNAAALNPNAQAWTIELWFKCDRTSGENILYNKENLYEAAVKDGYFRYAWQPNWVWTSGFPVIAGEWYHIAIVYDLSKQQVYQNGSLVTSRDQTGNVNSNTSKLLIAARGDNAPYSFFRGNIREFRIWNTARTSTEIRGLMNLSLMGNEAGLVGYWRMNEGTGTQAQDDTTNQRHGTIRGATWSNMRSRITHDSIAFLGAQTFPEGEGELIQQINQAQRRVLEAQTALDQAKREVQAVQADITAAEIQKANALRERVNAERQLIELQQRSAMAMFDWGMTQAAQAEIPAATERLNKANAAEQAAATSWAMADRRLQSNLATQAQAERTLQITLNDPGLEALSYRIGLGSADSLVYDSYKFHRWRARGEEKMSLDESGNLKVSGSLKVRNTENFSFTGEASHNSKVNAPSGGTDAWNIFISPKTMGREEAGSEADNALLMLNVSYAETAAKDGWTITARYKYKIANANSGDGGSQWFDDGKVSYLIVPK